MEDKKVLDHGRIISEDEIEDIYDLFHYVIQRSDPSIKRSIEFTLAAFKHIAEKYEILEEQLERTDAVASAVAQFPRNPQTAH